MFQHVLFKKKTASLLVLGFVLAGCEAQNAKSSSPQSVTQNQTVAANAYQGLSDDIPYAEYLEHKIITLDNGLRVVLHKDNSIPFTSLALYLHVGSKDEPEGKSGFAHLFEHLLFNGTPNNPGEFFQTLDKIGGSSVNGTTNGDRTNYFETVPASSLEALLWIEADRLKNILDGITKEKIQTQIDVVKNEKGLGENEPFGTSFYSSIESLYPKGHPYHHSTIGSIEDLESASIEDVEKWFEKFYGARNAVISIAGDFEYDEAEALVRKHFSHIEPGPDITQIQELPVKRTLNTQHTVYDVAPTSAIQRFYALPPVREKEDMAIKMAASFIAGRDYSPLVDGLVNKHKLASMVSGSMFSAQLANTYVIHADAAEGVSLDELASAMDELMAEILKNPPTQQDLDRQIGSYENSVINVTGDNLGKALSLGEGALYYDDPLRDIRLLEWMKETTPEAVHKAAIEWFSKGHHTARHVAHEKPFTTIEPKHDVNTLPAFGGATPLDMPAPNEFQLSNGLNIVHVKHSRTPKVQMVLILPTGQNTMGVTERVQSSSAIDIISDAGIGTQSHSDVAGMKTELGMFSLADMRHDHSFLLLDASKKNLDRSLDIWVDEILSPEFKEDDIERYKRQMREGLTQSLKLPRTVATEKTMSILRGDEVTITRQERLDALKTINRDVLVDAHKVWMAPNDATLFVVGDISQESLKPLLEKKFGRWDNHAEIKKRIIHEAPAPVTKPRFILVNKEGSTQSDVYAIRRVDFEFGKDQTAIEYADKIFGGGFNSRLNLNIREDKGWSYGVGSQLTLREDRAEWNVGGTVTGKHTVDTIKEMLTEMETMTASNPISKDELSKVIEPDLKTMARLVESTHSIMTSLVDNYLLDRAYDYPETEQARLRALDVKNVNLAAQSYLKTDDLVWMVVGDLSEFEDELRAAKLGDVEVYDLDGKRVR